jgi:hypothetical protein
MVPRTYCRSDLALKTGSSAVSEILEGQADLRALGYLLKGIDGKFGGGTE